MYPTFETVSASQASSMSLSFEPTSQRCLRTVSYGLLAQQASLSHEFRVGENSLRSWQFSACRRAVKLGRRIGVWRSQHSFLTVVGKAHFQGSPLKTYSFVLRASKNDSHSSVSLVYRVVLVSVRLIFLRPKVDHGVSVLLSDFLLVLQGLEHGRHNDRNGFRDGGGKVYKERHL